MAAIQKQKAFTLIELLIVISIIGLLSSIILVNVSTARAKSRDAKRKVDMKQLYTGIQIYYNDTGLVPSNQTPGIGYGDTQPNFLFELVNAGILAKSPKGPKPGTGYYYYDYGAGNTVGALLVTILETGTPSTQGEYPSCRPWPAAANWCDQSSNLYYCLCSPR